MKYYFAPLEGVCRYRYRSIHHKHFAGMDAYYSPFVVTRDGGIMKNKEMRDILPENNKGYKLIPQFLTNNSSNFIKSSLQVKDLGYDEINLNLGCPSGTVTGKGRGAGFLKEIYREDLKRFLDDIFEKCPLDISIKTRLSWENPEEFYEIMDLYSDYPIKELSIHLRTRKEMYKAPIHEDIFENIYREYVENNDKNKMKICFNGEVRTIKRCLELEEKYPQMSAIMIGRGLLANPGLISELKGYKPVKEDIKSFYLDIEEEYTKALSSEDHLLHKMKELWIYMAGSFTNYQAYLKKIKKSKKFKDYKEVVDKLFENEEWKPEVGFTSGWR